MSLLNIPNDPFTMEDIKDIPKKKLISIDNYYFDVTALREYLFRRENIKYCNPFTTLELKNNDLDKILNVDSRKIYYFCV